MTTCPLVKNSSLTLGHERMHRDTALPMGFVNSSLKKNGIWRPVSITSWPDTIHQFKDDSRALTQPTTKHSSTRMSRNLGTHTPTSTTIHWSAPILMAEALAIFSKSSRTG